MLSRKIDAWRGLPLTVVATSSWLAQCARSSTVFNDKRIEVLPNCIDTTIYAPHSKAEAREAFGLPIDKRLILISADNVLQDPRKGYRFLREAIGHLNSDGRGLNTELVVIGTSQKSRFMNAEGMVENHVGRLDDEHSQVRIYSAADVLVAPSVQENLSNTVMESLSCGTPVVAFRIGGMPDLIEHNLTGYLADGFDSRSLADGIFWTLSQAQESYRISRSCRSVAVSRYSVDHVIPRYLELYESILK